MTTTPALPNTKHFIAAGGGRSTTDTDTTVNLPGCVLFISINRWNDYYRYTFDTGTEIIIRNARGTERPPICTVNAEFVTAAEVEHALQQQFAEAATK